MEEKEKVDISDLSIYYQELLFQNEEMKRIMDTLFAGLQPVRSCEKQKSVRKQHQQER